MIDDCPGSIRALASFLEEAPRFDTLTTYWRNPALFEAERAYQRAKFNTAMAEHDARVRRQMLGEDA